MAGLGIALISAHTIAAEVETGRLVCLDVEELPILRQSAKIQLSSCPGPQPFQSGAPSRQPRGLQTKALRRVGRVERPRGLIAAWVCACCAQRRRPAVALTKPGWGPGPNSIGGVFAGPSPSRDPKHDVVTALAHWVEDGAAPDQIVATRYKDNDPSNGVEAQRPWCVYPEIARYTGQTVDHDAAPARGHRSRVRGDLAGRAARLRPGRFRVKRP